MCVRVCLCCGATKTARGQRQHAASGRLALGERVAGGGVAAGDPGPSAAAVTSAGGGATVAAAAVVLDEDPKLAAVAVVAPPAAHEHGVLGGRAHHAVPPLDRQPRPEGEQARHRDAQPEGGVPVGGLDAVRVVGQRAVGRRARRALAGLPCGREELALAQQDGEYLQGVELEADEVEREHERLERAWRVGVRVRNRR